MKNIIVACFMLVCSSAYAQEHATSHTKCQLEVDDILRQQSFDIDEPISEDARYIFFEMYETLNLIYRSESMDPKRGEYIGNFNLALQKAADLELNISMFQKDIDFVNKISQ